MKKSLFKWLMFALVAVLLGGFLSAVSMTSAAAKETDNTASPSQTADTGQNATTAEFRASWNGTDTAKAKAKAVAIAGADATGKILLEEMRAHIPQAIQNKWKPPTRAQLNRYGTIVHSLSEAKRVVAQQTKVYKDLVTKAQVKIRELQVKLRHATSPQEKRKLKRQLDQARKHLHALYVDKYWKYRPLIGLARGVCFVNTGYLGNMDVQQFVECVDGDKKVVWIGYSLVFDEMRIVAVEMTDGTIKPGCLNQPDFDIPPGTPPESMFIMVKAFAEVDLSVMVEVEVVGDLTVTGTMYQDGVVCDQDEKTQHVDETKTVGPITVHDTDVDHAMEVAEHQVQADATAMAQVKEKVKAEVTTSVSLELTLECAGTTHQQPLIEPAGVVHLVINPNETDPWVMIWVRVKVDPAASFIVSRPTLSPNSMGYISDWNLDSAATSQHNDGWTYYSGRLHAYPNDPDGMVTLSSTVTDSFGGTADTTWQVQIVHDGGADV